VTTASDAGGVRRKQAIRLEWFTLGWMTLEASVAVMAGIIARSIALTGFGLDSLIEFLSATLVLRRLLAELTSRHTDEASDRRVLRVIAVTFFMLAAYVLVQSTIDLTTRSRPETAPAGIALTAAALVVMPLLAWRKRQVGRALKNQLILADASETVLCAVLALTTLIGLVMNAAFSWWWADPVAAFGVVYFAIREGVEAWRGELACDDD